ncbi:MAG: hypothetical protein KGL59_05070 [Acidobacteriota bacterium]|nr:hypothetical protein [Acidobacteriota bacterium]
MDKKAFSEVEKRLSEVNKLIAKLDPSIRAAAFDFLKPYLSSGTLLSHPDPHRQHAEQAPSGDVSQLIEKHGDGKPHENVNLIAAIWFNDYGSHPFSLEHVREKASSTGLTIPDRLDMTLKQAKEKGKNLYVPTGRGLFRPTVVGESFLKATYGVRKGTKAPAAEK